MNLETATYKQLRERIVRYEQFIGKLAETLQWYANPNIYFDVHDEHPEDTIAEVDNGQRARDVLKERL